MRRCNRTSRSRWPASGPACSAWGRRRKPRPIPPRMTGASPAKHGRAIRGRTCGSERTSPIRSLLQNAAEAAPVDDKAKDQLRFGVRQFVGAMSPANFLVTNPEAQQLARETNGQSLVEGMQLFFQDLAKGRISTTDEATFEVGSNVAV